MLSDKDKDKIAGLLASNDSSSHQLAATLLVNNDSRSLQIFEQLEKLRVQEIELYRMKAETKALLAIAKHHKHEITLQKMESRRCLLNKITSTIFFAVSCTGKDIPQQAKIAITNLVNKENPLPKITGLLTLFARIKQKQQFPENYDVLLTLSERMNQKTY